MTSCFVCDLPMSFTEERIAHADKERANQVQCPLAEHEWAPWVDWSRPMFIPVEIGELRKGR